jgi:hypothetical protein
MKKDILKYLFLSCTVLALFSACRKDDYESDSPAGKGTSFVRIVDAPVKNIFYSPFVDVKEATLFTVRKDAKDKADLNQATTVTLKPVSLISIDSAYADFEVLPTTIFTLNNQAITAGADGSMTINFAPGQDVQKFDVKLDGSKFDLSKKYALAYEISDASGLVSKSGKGTLIVTVGIKNKYDGTYEVTGTMVDDGVSTNTHPNTGLGADAPMQYELRTLSATECEVYDNYVFGGDYIIINTPDGINAYGSFGIVMKFDLATDKVVAVRNIYGQPASNTRSAEIDPTGVNAYDPATKTIKLKYFMLQPSVITAPPYVRVKFDETWTYIGER